MFSRAERRLRPYAGFSQHRWTAESLRSRMGGETLRECCRRSGEFLIVRVAESRSMSDAVTAVRLFLNAAEYDRAVGNR